MASPCCAAPPVGAGCPSSCWTARARSAAGAAGGPRWPGMGEAEAMPTEREQLAALGARLRAARVAKGSTQVGLARRLGYTANTWVSQFERGQTRPPLARLRQLCDLLGLDFVELAVLAGYGRPPAT